MKRFLIFVLLIAAASAFAQEGTLELLRKDLKTQKVAIMTTALPLTEKQGEAFWPLYREYDHELSLLGDRRLAVLKEFAANYDSLKAKQAEKLVKESFSIANDRNELLKKYYKKVAKVLGEVTAARFLQVENQMLTLIDAQVVSQVPLIKPEKVASQETK